MVSAMGGRRPIAIDLFAGAGGMTLGFEQAGFDVPAAVELDPIHCATHEFNFPFWSVLCQDIADTTGDQIRNCIGDREIDVVCGGPPCQGFSVIGKRQFSDPRNCLISHFLRVVLELEPKYFVMENVPGLALGKHQQLLNDIISEFTANGYQVLSHQVLNAANYGVPQNRERLFMLGCRQGLPLPQYPSPITRPNKNQAENQDLPLTPTVWQAIGDLPEAENYPVLRKRDQVVAEYGKPSDYGQQMRGLCMIADDYSYARQYDPRLLTSSIRTNHTKKSRARFEATGPGKIERVSRFYKLNPEGLCNTLRAGTARDRGAYTSPRPIHPYTPRCITVREAGRLHSYPDWLRFHVTKWHGFRQIGNSVPPLLAKAVAAEIIRSLGVEPCKPAEEQPLGQSKWLHMTMSQAAACYEADPQAIGRRSRRR
ncbi:MAG: DNA cytosine methyltransferase [Hormoscilla sp. SP12CHS1]|nr:DNA cytosine methyltransferase [Hormoscilla sp. SP12CHS1]